MEFHPLKVRVLPDISQSVPVGTVLPLHKVALPVQSDIFVRPPMSFPELACWDENGKPMGWNFGLPLPPPNSDETPLEVMPAA